MENSNTRRKKEAAAVKLYELMDTELIKAQGDIKAQIEITSASILSQWITRYGKLPDFNTKNQLEKTVAVLHGFFVAALAHNQAIENPETVSTPVEEK